MPTATETQPGIAVTPVTTVDSRGRIASVDALRGFDMFWIIGADALFYALNKFGGGDGTSLIGFFATQLDHVQWAGFRFYDLIFPMFVFIVGVSIVFALSKRVASPAARRPPCRSFAARSSFICSESSVTKVWPRVGKECDSWAFYNGLQFVIS